MSNSSIWHIDMTLSGATTPDQTEPGSNSSEGVLRIPQRRTFFYKKESPSWWFLQYIDYIPSWVWHKTATDGEAPVLETWGIWSTLSLSLLQGPLWLEVVELWVKYICLKIIHDRTVCQKILLRSNCTKL